MVGLEVVHQRGDNAVRKLLHIFGAGTQNLYEAIEALVGPVAAAVFFAYFQEVVAHVEQGIAQYVFFATHFEVGVELRLSDTLGKLRGLFEAEYELVDVLGERAYLIAAVVLQALRYIAHSHFFGDIGYLGKGRNKAFYQIIITAYQAQYYQYDGNEQAKLDDELRTDIIFDIALCKLGIELLYLLGFDQEIAISFCYQRIFYSFHLLGIKFFYTK